MSTAAYRIERLPMGELARRCAGKAKLRDPVTQEVLRDADGKALTRPCEKAPIRGGTVCMSHGGAAKHIRAKADRRLMALAEPMLERQHELATQTDNPAVAQKATTDLLDRAGVGAVVQAKVRASHNKQQDQGARIQVNIGYLSAGPMEQPAFGAAINVTPIPDAPKN